MSLSVKDLDGLSISLRKDKITIPEGATNACDVQVIYDRKRVGTIRFVETPTSYETSYMVYKDTNGEIITYGDLDRFEVCKNTREMGELMQRQILAIMDKYLS